MHNVSCGTPIRAWSSKKFCWIYYPYQCGMDSCAFCIEYSKQKRDRRILDAQSKIPGSFIYKLSSSSLSDNLIKRIKHNGGNYLRLSGDDFNYIVSDYKDDWVEQIDKSPNELVEQIINEWPKLRLTENKKESTESYAITRVTSNAPKLTRDTVFLLSHILIPEIESLSIQGVSDALQGMEIKLLTMTGYQANVGKTELKSSTRSQIKNGIELNIEKATIMADPNIESVLNYVRLLPRDRKDFLG